MRWIWHGQGRISERSMEHAIRQYFTAVTWPRHIVYRRETFPVSFVRSHGVFRLKFDVYVVPYFRPASSSRHKKRTILQPLRFRVVTIDDDKVIQSLRGVDQVSWGSFSTRICRAFLGLSGIWPFEFSRRNWSRWYSRDRYARCFRESHNVKERCAF